ncbi:MAG: outer membrane beta-barrel protein [Bacteroidales bacterium]|nr:outer membrane beta-barrel protein [Bacteroidales bacterium]MCF8388354.1 outer membrane beta-barrel protein [Bacteroidales bacterium]MCF8399276.1 outer membrane beta-barrel protein [Bacteroidales bacterium]
MKKILIISLLLMLWAPYASKAQDYKNELNLSYGLATSNDFAEVFASVFDDIIYNIFGEGATSADTKSTGAFLLTYQRNLSKVISVGPVLGYEKITDEVDKDDKKIGEIKHDIYTIAAEGRIHYFNRSDFGMYLGVGAGISSFSSSTDSKQAVDGDTDTDTNFTFHVTALGLRIGNQLCANAELGFGYRGLINLGLSYRF